MPETLREPDAPQSHQDLVVGCILLTLAEQRGHGYELHERIKQVMPLGDVSPGNLYRELRRMDVDGLVASVWEASQTRGPARRVYEIT
ncbi:MAG: helix-turn-helix transcriptional regulator, partial [Acidimicrobiales bacterium]|nr:helix-turn-helix transcriptional regulator [Acidimicrobiales bacterium]